MNTRDLLEKRMENIRMSPTLRAQIHARVRRKHALARGRMLPVLALILALTLLAGVALAYSQGLFGRLAIRADGSMEKQLTRLDENASLIGAVHVIPASGAYSEATISIDQAYYDGRSLYVSYSIASDDQQDGLANGGSYTQLPPPESLDGFERFYDSIDEVSLLSDDDRLRISEAIARGERVCVQICSQSLSETPQTADGEPVPPLTGGSVEADGVYSAWTKFESPLPESLCGLDSLTLRYDFIRVTTTILFTGEGIFMKWDREDALPVEFTVPCSAQTRTLHASEAYTARDTQGSETAYTLEASLTCSSVSLEAVVTLSDVPDAWLNALADGSVWDAPAPWHPPIGFDLYAHGDRLTPTDGSVSYDAQAHTITYQFATLPCDADAYTVRASYGSEANANAIEIHLSAAQ